MEKKTVTAGQLLEILRTVPEDTELFTAMYDNYMALPKYYKIKKAMVQTMDNGNYMVALVDGSSGSMI